MAATILQTEALRKIYTTGAVEVAALRGVDFAARAGEFVVLLGPSGSGKSTFLNIVGGLDSTTSGRVIFADHDLTVASDRALTLYRRDHVGFVFQFYNLVPSLTARENVALVTEIARDPMKPEEALAVVGLADRLDHFPAQLSGGEQQRVAIARAIAKRPQLLLCDEPTGALDSTTGVRVLEALTRVNLDIGATTLCPDPAFGVSSLGSSLKKPVSQFPPETHLRPPIAPGGRNFVVTRLVEAIEAEWRVGWFDPARRKRKTDTIDAIITAAMIYMDLAISIYIDAGRRERRVMLDNIAGTFESSVAAITPPIVRLTS